MKFIALLAALATATPGLTLAQDQAQPSRDGGTIAQLLAGGYEIKAAFVNANVSYVFLQKETHAFMCKSVANSLCEKLN